MSYVYKACTLIPRIKLTRWCSKYLSFGGWCGVLRELSFEISLLIPLYGINEVLRQRATSPRGLSGGMRGSIHVLPCFIRQRAVHDLSKTPVVLSKSFVRRCTCRYYVLETDLVSSMILSGTTSHVTHQKRRVYGFDRPFFFSDSSLRGFREGGSELRIFLTSNSDDSTIQRQQLHRLGHVHSGGVWVHRR